MNQELERAVKKMIQGELDAMNYYRQATRHMKDKRAIEHFNQLAQEEQEHLRRLVLKTGDPAVKAVVEKNADSTLNHLRLIQQDYQRLYGDMSGECT